MNPISIFHSLCILLLCLTTDTLHAQGPDFGEPGPIARITTAGASASAGFGVFTMKDSIIGRVPGGCSLGRTLKAAVGDSVVISDMGTSMFFTAPHRFGRRIIERVNQNPPDILVAVDFLFWFAYGTIGADDAKMQTASERMASLDVGLDLLDTFQGPMIVGDLPDMSAAIGGFLSRSQVPSPKILNALNAKIMAWASERSRVRIFPLAKLLTELNAQEPFTIGSHRWETTELNTVMQRDRLHPTLTGQIAIIQMVENILITDKELSARTPPMETDLTVLRERLNPPAPVAPKQDKAPATSE